METLGRTSQEVRVRPMLASDLADVVAIAAVVPTAPHWPPSEFLRMLDVIQAQPGRRGAWVGYGEPRSAGAEVPGLVVPMVRRKQQPAAVNPSGRIGPPGADPEGMGVVWGFAMASQVAGIAELEAVVTAPGFRRRGVGAALLAATAGWAVAQGAERLLLEARASNQDALRLYRRMGFQDDGVRPGYYNNPVEDAVLLSCALPMERNP
ncbi:GNAT family N-acetyltransferase [Acidipila sp. EB88]|uniref:GNAT family N-acetyltransferase n=1 Tax=Acidipila sp. EB88 TaxID=2305226 RepID=UPI000F5D65D5|nr:GNAT family N-acetyltransferase [Acidipila sp. EB88]RRA48893.1 GNAT family N-acetyltransferase [Acidipila sp. EB88]